ncbi:MAG: flagellar protein FlaG [Acidobacteria bacterium]|nr:flagellar protein FlaG [Acidobacteriota bacterium]
MADLIQPAGGITSGIAAAFMVPAKSRQAPDASRPAKDTQPQRPEGGRVESGPPSLESAAKDLQARVQKADSELKFVVDKSTGRTYFKVVNPQTGEVLIQIPPEEILSAARKLRELAAPKEAAGLLLDKKG